MKKQELDRLTIGKEYHFILQNHDGYEMTVSGTVQNFNKSGDVVVLTDYPTPMIRG